MSNFITALFTTDGKLAAKKFHRRPDGRIKETAYRAGYMFRHDRAEVNSIDDLFDLLRLLESQEIGFMIQGEVIPAFRDRSEITRTLYDLPEKHQTAMLQAIPDGTQMMGCDFDKITLPEGMTPQDGVEMLVQTLPEEFRQASFVYQLSSSAGVCGPGVKLVKTVDGLGEETVVEEYFDYAGWANISAHVYFWLSKKHTHLAQWAKNLNEVSGNRVIDARFLEIVQPNYCACPKFIEMDNPVANDQRSALVRKATDVVDLVWIDAPVRYVKIDKVEHKVGARVRMGGADGKLYIATPNLQDRLNSIGGVGGYRDPLMGVIGYYFWLKGRTADHQEIKTLIRTAPIDWAGRDYLGQQLDDMVDWFERRNAGHEPMTPNIDDLLLARLIEWRNLAPKLPDSESHASDEWVFDQDQTGLIYHYIGDECGAGKTEWLIDQIATKPRRYLICLPRIALIREVKGRLTVKYPTLPHLLHTIYTDKEGDIRDVEDAPDDQFASSSTTVTYQIQNFRLALGRRPAAVLFITHAAMLLSDWRTWIDFEMFADEIPDAYSTQKRNFANTPEFVREHVEINDCENETNFHRLGLTGAGYRKLGRNGSFDDNEQPIKGLMQAIDQPNVSVYAHKQGWDQMQARNLLLMRLLRAGFVQYFRNVTFIGDEFRRSTLAMAFENKFAVDWQPHPDWHPSRARCVPLKDRARIFYFASADELRGSLKGYEERQLIPKLIAWFNSHVPEQTLITTNRRYEHLFERPDYGYGDATDTEGVLRSPKGKKIHLLWLPPKQAGTDTYRNMTSVGFFAAMRPSRDEVAFVERSLLISEDETIRWREYNCLYQFIMRGVLRLYDSDEIEKVYVYDEYQAAYLLERFGGCLEFTHVTGVLPSVKAQRGGRPKKSNAMSGAERNQKARDKKKAENGTKTT